MDIAEERAELTDAEFSWAYETARMHGPHQREGFRCGWCAAKILADSLHADGPEQKKPKLGTCESTRHWDAVSRIPHWDAESRIPHPIRVTCVKWRPVRDDASEDES